MDKFALYHNVRNIREIAEQYSLGVNIRTEADEISEQLSSRNYRVAVIGEFKRGKSSLVNSILGTEVLPTDILPTTATINRIIYDTEEKLVINYKNGESAIEDVSSIANYATKLDKEKEKIAESIREIVVHYPSVFCENHIELIDTPGLNDNESMSEATFKVLDEIDTAIVVISATMPLSVTEQKLICSLIEQERIYHLTFVLTFIDRVSDEVEEQDRLVELVERRLREDTYSQFEKLHADDEFLMAKAESILKKPIVFAVSSKLAMKGFVNDDKKLLEESRFPHFKFRLSALLTANKELDLYSRTKRITDILSENIDGWYQEKRGNLIIALNDLKKKKDEAETYRDIGYKVLERKMQDVDEKIKNVGYCFSFENIDLIKDEGDLEKCFIKSLAEIRENDFTEERVYKALNESCRAATEKMIPYCERLKNAIDEGICRVDEEMALIRKNVGIDDSVFGLENWKRESQFPKFSIVFELLLKRIPALKGECMPYVKEEIDLSLKCYQEAVARYVASWRKIQIGKVIKDSEGIDKKIELYNESIAKCLAEIRETEDCYEENKENLEEIKNAIYKMGQEG